MRYRRARRAVDLRVPYERQSPWFFGFLVATLVVSFLKDFCVLLFWRLG